MASALSGLSSYYDRKTARDMDYRGYMEKQAMIKDIGTAIQRGTDQQMIMTGVVGANITSRIDQSTERLEHSMVRMQTGIQTSIRAQTYAIVASQAALANTFNQGFDRSEIADLSFKDNVTDELLAAIIPILSKYPSYSFTYDVTKRLNHNTFKMETVESKYLLSVQNDDDWTIIEEYDADSEIGKQLEKLVDWQ